MSSFSQFLRKRRLKYPAEGLYGKGVNDADFYKQAWKINLRLLEKSV